MGEAAGAAAALAVQTDIDPPALNVAALRSSLVDGGAIVSLDPLAS
jgi:hypothetical protein